MLNLVKMNCYYSVKTKLLWILLGLTMVLLILLYSMTEVSLDENAFLTFVETIKGADLLIILTIYTISLAGSKYKTGYIKNFGRIYNEFECFAADLFTVFIFTIILFFAALLANTICLIADHILINVNSVIEILPFIGLQLVQHIAVVCIFIFMVNFIRNITLCMVIGISYVCLVSMLIWNVVNSIIGKMFSGVSILNYIITYNIANIPYEISRDLYLKNLMLSLVIITVTILANVIFIRNRDIC